MHLGHTEIYLSKNQCVRGKKFHGEKQGRGPQEWKRVPVSREAEAGLPEFKASLDHSQTLCQKNKQKANGTGM